MSSTRDVTETAAWQLAHKLNLRVDLFLLSPDFRRYYKQSDRLHHAVRSGPRDIADGFDRERGVFADRLRRAKGSHLEVVRHLVDAHGQGLITLDELDIARRLAQRAIRAATALIRSLEATTDRDAAARATRRTRRSSRVIPTDSDSASQCRLSHSASRGTSPCRR